MLRNNYLPRRHNLLPNGGSLLQDNAPIHNANVTKNWFAQQQIDILNHPPVSPDLNCIENIWGDMKKTIYKKMNQIHTCDSLFLHLKFME